MATTSCEDHTPNYNYYNSGTIYFDDRALRYSRSTDKTGRPGPLLDAHVLDCGMALATLECPACPTRKLTHTTAGVDTDAYNIIVAHGLNRFRWMDLGFQLWQAFCRTQ